MAVLDMLFCTHASIRRTLDRLFPSPTWASGPEPKPTRPWQPPLAAEAAEEAATSSARPLLRLRRDPKSLIRYLSDGSKDAHFPTPTRRGTRLDRALFALEPWSPGKPTVLLQNELTPPPRLGSGANNRHPNAGHRGTRSWLFQPSGQQAHLPNKRGTRSLGRRPDFSGPESCEDVLGGSLSPDEFRWNAVHLQTSCTFCMITSPICN